MTRCFRIFTQLNPKDYLFHDAIVAPVVQVEMVKGEAFDHEGAVQRLRFKDGAVIEEEILRFIRNQQLVYRGVGFTQPLVKWASHVQASFEFTKKGEETEITWRYNFFLKQSPLNVIRKPVFKKVVVGFVWSRMMRGTLGNLVQIMTLRNKAKTT
ncbi:MAG: hypothetical protein R3194_07080 [Limnobacter sp.]|nr:hypothetical protein [Limnobacter sp.]